MLFSRETQPAPKFFLYPITKVLVFISFFTPITKLSFPLYQSLRLSVYSLSLIGSCSLGNTLYARKIFTPFMGTCFSLTFHKTCSLIFTFSLCTTHYCIYSRDHTFCAEIFFFPLFVYAASIFIPFISPCV
jgi:hypothetical protein